MWIAISFPRRNAVRALMAAVLAVGTSDNALAQYACPSGYTYSAGVCQPTGYGGPVSGAVTGSASGAAAGSAAAGPVGAVVGGALGIATGTVAGTANAVTGTTSAVTGVPVSPTPAPACAAGYMLYNGGCYPAR